MSKGQSERYAFQQKSPQTHTEVLQLLGAYYAAVIRVDIFSALMFASSIFLICKKRVNHQYRKEKREEDYF